MSPTRSAQRARAAKPKISTIAAFDDVPMRVLFKMRGVLYEIVELDIAEYDKLVQLASSTKLNSDGEEVESTNELLLLRLMIEKSLVQPKWNQVNKSTRIVRALEREVRDLHFGLETIEPVKDDDEDDEDDDAADPDDPNATGG